MKNDQLPTRRIYLVAVAIAAFVAIAALVVWAGGAARAPVAGHAAPASTFHDPPAADAVRAAAELRLRSYGWTDRDHRRVHIPIDVAIDLATRGKP